MSRNSRLSGNRMSATLTAQKKFENELVENLGFLKNVRGS